VSLPPHQAEKTGKPQQSEPSPITTVIPAFYGRLASIRGLYLGIDDGITLGFPFLATYSERQRCQSV